MRHTLSAAAATLRELGDMLAEAGARLSGVDPGPRAFGADAPGSPGDLARDLHRHWLRALDARAREAAAHGARAASTGDAVARAAAAYSEADEAAGAHRPEVP